MLRSVLSWMHWSRRRQERRAELMYQQEARLRLFLWETLLPQLLAEHRQQLWELALPLMDSLKRLDQRTLVSQMQQVEQQQEIRELLLEVLQAQMPPVSQQLGLSTLPPSPLSSVTSAPSSRRT
jgi:hypothetical protein